MRQSNKSRLLSRLLKYLRSIYGKQCGPRSDCSYKSSLFWVHAVCFYTLFVSNVRQLFAADKFSRQHFQMHFFLGALRVKGQMYLKCLTLWIYLSIVSCATRAKTFSVVYLKYVFIQERHVF